MLEKSVGMVRVAEPAGESVAVGHVLNASIPVTVHLLPGSYRVTLTAGHELKSTKTVVVAAGQTTLVTFERPPEPLPKPGAVESTSSRGATIRVLGWVGVGSALVFSGAAVGLGLAAVDRAHAFDDSGSTDTSARSSALTLRTLTNVAWGAAAATGVAGVFLLLLAPKSSSSSAAVRTLHGLDVGAGVVRLRVAF